MTILFVCNSDSWGGAEKYLIDLTAELGARGHIVHLAAPKGGALFDAASQHPRVTTHNLSLGPKLSNRSLLDFALGGFAYRHSLESFIRRMIDEHAIDVVHFQFKKEQILGARIRRLTGLPIVWTEHGTLPAALTQFPLGMWAYRRAAQDVSHCICVSEAVASNLRGMRVPVSKMQVVHNGVVPPNCRERPDRGSLGIPVRAPVIVTVARLAWNKGHRDLLETVAPLQKDFPDVKFLIVGDGPERGSLEQAVRALGISDSVIFAGHRNDVYSLLAVADLFVLPSHEEGLPYSVIEAMFAGLPVIATDVGGVAEAVGTNGRAGILIKPKSPELLAGAIRHILEMPEADRRQMGRVAAGVANERFAFAGMVDRTEVVLEGAVAQ